MTTARRLRNSNKKSNITQTNLGALLCQLTLFLCLDLLGVSHDDTSSLCTPIHTVHGLGNKGTNWLYYRPKNGATHKSIVITPIKFIQFLFYS